MTGVTTGRDESRPVLCTRRRRVVVRDIAVASWMSALRRDVLLANHSAGRVAVVPILSTVPFLDACRYWKYPYQSANRIAGVQSLQAGASSRSCTRAREVSISILRLKADSI